MNLNNVIMLPKTITSTENLADEFRELLNSPEAKNGKGIVYFLRSVRPVPRLRGKSDVLYIGKTNQSLRTRYYRYADNLAANQSGVFYKHIIENYGGLRLGYIKVDSPKEREALYFKLYREEHLENPPKSKVG